MNLFLARIVLVKYLRLFFNCHPCEIKPWELTCLLCLLTGTLRYFFCEHHCYLSLWIIHMFFKSVERTQGVFAVYRGGVQQCFILWTQKNTRAWRYLAAKFPTQKKNKRHKYLNWYWFLWSNRLKDLKKYMRDLLTQKNTEYVKWPPKNLSCGWTNK